MIQYYLSVRFVRLALLVAGFAVIPGVQTASAQLSRVNPVSGPAANLVVVGGGQQIHGTDSAYDPNNGVYLLVGGFGPVWGIFINADGNPVSGAFTIWTSGFAQRPRVRYSTGEGGGNGRFLVIWHSDGSLTPSTGIHAATVTYPGTVGSVQLVSSPDPNVMQGGSFTIHEPNLAYSPVSDVFLVVWTTLEWGIQGRLVGLDGVPILSPVNIDPPGDGDSSRFTAVAWNNWTNEFGVAYTGFGGNSAFAKFRRVSTSGVSGADTFGFSSGTFAAGLDVNPDTGSYLMSWWSGDTQGALFNSAGTRVGTGLLLGGSHVGTDNMGLAFSPISKTFLVGGSHHSSFDVVGAELNANGAPVTGATMLTSGATAGSFYPRISAQTAGAARWNVVFSRGFLTISSQIIGTSSANGAGTASLGAPPPSGGGGSGCSTAQPGAGWTCVNGGWVPPSTGGSGGTGDCSTPDPFASIGGGTCVNGGWLPGGGGSTSGGCTTASPGAGWTCVNGGWNPPSTGGGGSSGSGNCSTPDPFASIGGGTCVNGGWLPGGSGSGGGSTGGCSTSSPGTGWTCVNGGWLPPSGGGGSTGNCSTPDPFASIGGGTCVSGGWIPGGSGSGGSTGGCSTSSPGTGWTCVSGGWLPPSGGGGGSTGGNCSTPDPFASIGGGTCVNGGWIPGGSGSTSGGCSTASPGTGWTCVNGGWLPPSGGGGSTSGNCSTPDPFLNIGGGICVNGGWIPGPNAAGGCTTPNPFVSLASLGMVGVCRNGGWVLEFQ